LSHLSYLTYRLLPHLAKCVLVENMSSRYLICVNVYTKPLEQGRGAGLRHRIQQAPISQSFIVHSNSREF